MSLFATHSVGQQSDIYCLNDRIANDVGKMDRNGIAELTHCFTPGSRNDIIVRESLYPFRLKD